MANEKFSDEYKAQRELLLKSNLQGQTSSGLLKKLLGNEAPERGSVAALELMRTLAKKIGEAKFILQGAGLSDTATSGTPPADGVKAAALIKFMRHLYLAGSRGSQNVWVFSSPKAYRQYPQDEVIAESSSYITLTSCLSDVTEVFDDSTKLRMAEVTQLGLNWCLAAQTTLSTAKTDTAAMNKVKRWFDDGTSTPVALEQTMAKVLAGFKKMASTMNSCSFIITDMPKDRANPKQELTEAYIFNLKETPKTVYVEKAFFENYDVSVLHDMKKNWARIIVHEVSHIDAATEDKSYAWQGIGVGTSLSPAQASVNADTWAFFAADCGGALTAGDICRAGAGTGGNLNKLPKNWL